MLTITYAPADSDAAEALQAELSASGLRLTKQMMLVLVSPEGNDDKTVQQAAYRARDDEKITLVAIQVADAPLPDALADAPAFDMSGDYETRQLLRFLRRVDMGEATRNSNRRLLFYLLAAAVLVFAVSIWAIASGTVGAPNDEFATENAIRDATVRAITDPTVEFLLPRSTDEAAAFVSTLEALDNEDLAPLVAGTATGVVRDRQATQDAIATAAAATSTARADD